jgi:ubiquinone/menaquinone biosynthesis C-methylase UbiE
MPGGDEPRPPDEVLAFYARGREDERLSLEKGKLERERTEELLRRFLPAPPGIVLDVGGGTGHYAVWLASLGYDVHVIDPVPLHVEQAHERSEAQPDRPLASIRQGDARRLEWPDNQADAVLLLGPLYHLTEREDRGLALREAWRVLQPAGLVLAAAISRFASALDGLVSRYFTDPRFASIVWQDLADGQHRGTPDGAFFTTAYLHQPEELALELAEANFVDSRVVAIEGPGWLLQDFDDQWADPALREPLLEVIRRTESEPSLLGASSHLLGIARKPAVTSR